MNDSNDEPMSDREVLGALLRAAFCNGSNRTTFSERRVAEAFDDALEHFSERAFLEERNTLAERVRELEGQRRLWLDTDNNAQVMVRQETELEAAADRIRSLEAANAKLEQDAKRYRFLREPGDNKKPFIGLFRGGAFSKWTHIGGSNSCRTGPPARQGECVMVDETTDHFRLQLIRQLEDELRHDPTLPTLCYVVRNPSGEASISPAQAAPYAPAMETAWGQAGFPSPYSESDIDSGSARFPGISLNSPADCFAELNQPGFLTRKQAGG